MNLSEVVRKLVLNAKWLTSQLEAHLGSNRKLRLAPTGVTPTCCSCCECSGFAANKAAPLLRSPVQAWIGQLEEQMRLMSEVVPHWCKLVSHGEQLALNLDGTVRFADVLKKLKAVAARGV